MQVLSVSMWQGPTLLSVATLWLALLIDRVFGEPAPRWHPVVWMGKLLEALSPWVAPAAAVRGQAAAAWLRGTLAWTLGAVLAVTCAFIWQWGVWQLPTALALPLSAVALKPLLAWRMLRDETLAVEHALANSLDDGRARVARLVSREVSTLEAAEVRESAIETLAENLNDSVVAPLFWFLLAGLPGAALYRWANTADAMWGYPGERSGRNWAWAGQWAARMDDVLSWISARLTGVLLLALGGIWRWRTWLREARRTPSPNSGRPMAAMALALDVSLSKPGVYRLHATGRAPGAEDTLRAARLAERVVWAVAGLALALPLPAFVWATAGGWR